MNFAQWLLNEEIYFQNNTAVIYHRTSNLGTVSSMLSEIFKAGGKNGCALGCGLYGVTDLNYQFDIYVQDYGKYITKWKITGLNEFLILIKDQAAKIHGIDSPVSKQLQKLGVLEDWKKVAGESWQNILAKYDEQPSYKFLEDYPDWVEKNLKGAVYYDSRFGICVLKYPPVEEGVTFLAYAEAPVTGDKATDKNTMANLQWQKEMFGTSVKSLYRAKVAGRDISQKVVEIKPLTLTPENFESHPVTFRLSPTTFIWSMKNKNSVHDYPEDIKYIMFNKYNQPLIFKYLPKFKQVGAEKINKKGQTIDTGMVDSDYQWHMIVNSKNDAFTLNNNPLSANTEVPLNNNDKFCVKGKSGKQYCFTINAPERNKKPEKDYYYLGNIRGQLLGRELKLYGSNFSHEIILDPQQMLQLTGIKSEATISRKPLFGTTPQFIDFSKKGYRFDQKYGKVNQVFSGDFKLVGNTLTIDDKPLIKLNPEQMQNLMQDINSIVEINPELKQKQENEQPQQKQAVDNDEAHQKALASTGYWGKQGAGSIVVARDTGRILLPFRDESVQDGNTWGTWGGAIDDEENPEIAAKRELQEEAGYSGNIEMIPLQPFKDGDFIYHNFLAIVDYEFKPKTNWETKSTMWTTLDKIPVPLHYGLKFVLTNSGQKIADVVKRLNPKAATQISSDKSLGTVKLVSLENNEVNEVGENSYVGKNIIRTPEAKRFMSTYQFLIFKKDGIWHIMHVPYATNKTRVNGVQLEGKTPLKNGDVISMGKKGLVPIKVVIEQST